MITRQHVESHSGRYLVAIDVDSSLHSSRQKKLFDKDQLFLGNFGDRVSSCAEVSLRFRNSAGRIEIDNAAHLHVQDKTVVAYSTLWSSFASTHLRGGVLLCHVEQIGSVARIWIHHDTKGVFQFLAANYPELRLAAFGLPPVDQTFVDSEEIIQVLTQWILKEDRELVAPQSDNFLRAPPILVPLATHVAGLSADENLRFPIQLKKLADHFRYILEEPRSRVRITKLERNHLETWAAAQGRQYAFLDGGVARVLGIPGGEPTAFRVGVYCARAGDTSMVTREKWDLIPFVLGDVVDRVDSPPIPEDRVPDVRRLAEAARYTLEALTALRYAEKTANLEVLFAHGPLINQFVMYDEGEPHFIPALREDFLNEWGISRTNVESAIQSIPNDSRGKSMWRQFMAIYGFLARELAGHRTPIVGVIERSAGRWLAEAVLDSGVEAQIIKSNYKKKVMEILRKYNISDDFLFGCVLDEGEYVTPVQIFKNNPRRSRENWHEVVRQYPHPHATVLKTSAMTFPFRVEMNAAASSKSDTVMRFIYHTARLLPRYAFPVGLNIVDKYAKVPDWLSKGVSARLGAVMLERAIEQGDPKIVAQLRQLLAHTPRDFFYRPH